MWRFIFGRFRSLFIYQGLHTAKLIRFQRLDTVGSNRNLWRKATQTCVRQQLTSGLKAEYNEVIQIMCTAYLYMRNITATEQGRHRGRIMDGRGESCVRQYGSASHPSGNRRDGGTGSGQQGAVQAQGSAGNHIEGRGERVLVL